MKVSPRARLAWANRNLEAAADIIVADWLREVSEEDCADGARPWSANDFSGLADSIDPEGATA